MQPSLLQSKAVILVSHITDLAGPTEALGNYLTSRAKILDQVCHPMPYCADRNTRFVRYVGGCKCAEGRQFGFKLPSILTYIRDVLLTLFFFFRFRAKYDIFIGVDPLNCIVGIFLKWLGFVDKVYFYTIDWMPTRFQNKGLNSIYHWVDRICVRFCDVAWNLSPAIAQVRREQGLPETRNVYVPVGVELNKIRLSPEGGRPVARKCVILGALAPSKGPDLIIEAWPEILAEISDAKLYVIGKTPSERVEHGVTYAPYEPRFEALGQSATVLGVMSHDDVLKILPEFDIGLALYKPYADNLTAWADPSRVKDYLACGLPTIITAVPSIAADIEAHRCGLVVRYTVKELVKAVAAIAKNPEMFLSMRRNALAFMSNFSWEAIFDKAFLDSLSLDGL